VTRRALVLATRSADKLRELEDLFRSRGYSLLSLDGLGIPSAPEEDSLEVADSFEGNALAKARFFAGRLGRPVVADDSGLEVAALGGRPGVLSKRWSGRPDLSGKWLDEANNAHLVKELAGVHDRRARYVCAASFCDGRTEIVFRGTTSGSILEQPRGTHGFGYDPYFFSDELGVTFGEASLERKQTVSHRARAFTALLAALEQCG
jgi:XTP/dITP diphosphohydrolase